jgi:predicted amidohydrolase
MLVKVALLQITGCGSDKNANLAKGDIFCRRARAMGADIALFPEMFSVGMTYFDPKIEGDRERWQAASNQPRRFIYHSFP